MKQNIKIGDEILYKDKINFVTGIVKSICDKGLIVIDLSYKNEEENLNKIAVKVIGYENPYEAFMIKRHNIVIGETDDLCTT